MLFEVQKDKLFSVIFYGLFLVLGLMLIVILNSDQTSENTLGIIVTVSGLLLLVWIWYVTDYKIQNNVLTARSGPFSKNIPIRTITKVEVGKTSWSGYKLALARNGLVIHYNKGAVIYISPENQEKFCKHLKIAHKKIQFEQN